MPKSVFSDAQNAVVEALIVARQASGLRQVDLAIRLGKDQSFISNIERRERRVDLVEFCALAMAMDVDPIALFTSVVQNLPETIEI